MTKTALQFRHNGRDVAVFVDGGVNLLVALRELIGDMTAKFGCGQGGCGACSVLIDGELHLSCLTLAESVVGRSVQTLDGIKDGPNLHPLQLRAPHPPTMHSPAAGIAAKSSACI